MSETPWSVRAGDKCTRVGCNKKVVSACLPHEFGGCDEHMREHDSRCAYALASPAAAPAAGPGMAECERCPGLPPWHEGECVAPPPEPVAPAEAGIEDEGEAHMATIKKLHVVGRLLAEARDELKASDRHEHRGLVARIDAALADGGDSPR